VRRREREGAPGSGIAHEGLLSLPAAGSHPGLSYKYINTSQKHYGHKPHPPVVTCTDGTLMFPLIIQTVLVKGMLAQEVDGRK
jgi:hypothetical protein